MKMTKIITSVQGTCAAQLVLMISKIRHCSMSTLAHWILLIVLTHTTVVIIRSNKSVNESIKVNSFNTNNTRYYKMMKI